VSILIAISNKLIYARFEVFSLLLRERERERQGHVSRWFCCQNYVTSVIDEWFNMEHWWNDIDGKTEVLGEKPVPFPLCPPQISHGLAWDRTQASEDVDQPPEPLKISLLLDAMPCRLVYV